jgi:uncharacterized protein YutE (UPF0331/DUF86 family)
MPNEEIVLKLIDQLKDYLRKLKELQSHSEEEFLESWRIEWQIGRGLQLAVETSIDLSQEIIAELEEKKPSSYAETFVILHRAGVISKEVGDKMKFLANFRNKIVHDYLSMDPKEVYESFQDTLPFLEQFVSELEEFMMSSRN